MTTRLIGATAVVFLLGVAGAARAQQCGDNVCELLAGEDHYSCPQDCAITCGNNNCDPGDLQRCPDDCPRCGNGVCDSIEDPISCAADCPAGPACGDGRCDPGENWLSCAADCACEPQACGDRCGRVSDGCGGWLDCPSCIPSCGNGVCDLAAGEDHYSCSADCAISCGNNNCDPGDLQRCPDDCPRCGNGVCESSEDPLSCAADCPAGPVCGDGRCEAGENASSCSADCACQPQACGDRCGPWPDGCGGTLHCRPCDAVCGDGVCHLELGEDFESCRRDCDQYCGDGQCTATEATTCPDDCVCRTEVCAAGCAYVPMFTVSDSSPVIRQLVTLTLTDLERIVPGSAVDWDFDDGETCIGCGTTVTHAYARPGAYLPWATATENRCSSRQRSAPRVVSVKDVALHRGDFAKVAGHTLPRAMCDKPVSVTVTMLNMGTTDWSSAAGYKLGAVAEADFFAPQTRVELPPGVVIRPRESHTFTFTLRPYPHAGDYVTDWQMLREGEHWFGDIAQSTATVDPEKCPVGPPNGEQYHCEVTASDGYGVPLPTKGVYLKAYVEERSERELVAEVYDVTDDEGRKFLSVSADVVNYLECAVDLGPKGRHTRRWLRSTIPPIPRGTVLQVDGVEAPTPTTVEHVRGLKDPAARVGLYQSGAYDKVMVLTEPMNPQEQERGARSLADLWWEFSSLLQLFHEREYDVWLVNTSLTGQNIHEQAAEAVEAIQLAARDYPARIGASAFDGRVVVGGVSLGGITARVATARWDSPAAGDQAWRDRLGISGPLPVKLLMFVDSPLRGAIISRDLQDFLWDPPFSVAGPTSLESSFNLNSCTFQQLAFDSTVGGLGCLPGGSSTCNHDAFFQNGTDVRFKGTRGTCDDRTSGRCVCEAGPAVESINGNGFPHGVRMIAYSDGAWGEPNRCYGDERDRNRDGYDVCFDSDGRAFTPRTGDTMYELICDGDSALTMRFRPADLVPGSRQSAYLANKVAFAFPITCNVSLIRQFASGTFIPITSSLASDTPGCGPFDACYTRDHSGTHVNIKPHFVQSFLVPELERAFGGTSARALSPVAQAMAPAVAQPGQPILLDGRASGDPDGTVVQHEWEFGDGTAEIGETASHAYATAGTYTLKLTVVDDTGMTDTSTTTVRVGPPNEPPELHLTAPSGAGTGQPVTFDASATRDPDGTVAEYHWNLGDGTLGDGPTLTHAYLDPGDYQVTLTAIDDAGEARTWAGAVAVTGNHRPTLTITSAGSCGPAGCAVTFTATADDADGNPVSLAWAGCGGGSGTTLTCQRPSSGALSANVTAADTSGGTSSASAAAYVYAADHATGPWSQCSGDGELTCTSSSPTGCSRPGVQSRVVTESGWTLDEAGASVVPTSQACTETRQGYVADYSVEHWGACTASCGGGIQNRSVTASAWKATAPDATPPPGQQSCNTQRCALTCYDYPTTYPTRYECLDAGWAACERRFRDDGLGGTLLCWKGFD